MDWKTKVVAVVCLFSISAISDSTLKMHHDGMDLIKACAPDASGFNQGLCLGLAEGVYSGGSYCDPKGVTNGQLVLVVEKYLEDNPDKLSLSAVELIDHAFKKAWSCGKSK